MPQDSTFRQKPRWMPHQGRFWADLASRGKQNRRGVRLSGAGPEVLQHQGQQVAVRITRGQVYPDAAAGLPDAGADLQELESQGVHLGGGIMQNILIQESTSNLTVKRICLICHSTNVSTFLEIIDAPVHIGLLWSNKDSARQCPRGNINLGFCHSCGFISNLSFEPSLLEYTQAYDNSLDFSSRYQDYTRSLALRLIERYDLFDKDLIEIGCGKGNFLILLCELGGNRGVGFDTTYEQKRTDNRFLKQIKFIQDFYSEHYIDLKVDFICCRHVLEHIHNPIKFLTLLRYIIGERLSTAMYFEVPNALFILRDLSLCDIIYEHCSYFSFESLTRAFTSCGFHVRELSETFERQWLGIEVLPIESGNVSQLNDNVGSSVIAHEIINFTSKYHKKLEFWQENLERIAKTGQRAVLWGAGAKGVSFLNILNTQRQIEYVVDINPHKQGHYIPGTAQQIVPPKFLQEYRPDAVIVMNKNYAREIELNIKNLGLRPEIIFV